jgi:hypothetical protein
MRSWWPRQEWSVFVLLLGSYAFYWHSRDWNTASRLILTYAMADRGTLYLDGLDRQTGDIAFFHGHYFCDKLPGLSLLAMAPYSLTRAILGLPLHPLQSAPKDYWPSDYWITLGTSGLLSAMTAVLLVRLAFNLGCCPRRAALVGLAYGLATPAYVYATLAYGHQVSAFALTASFYLLYQRASGREATRLALAGFLAAYASVTELQVAPASAVLAIYLAAQCLARRRRAHSLGWFAVGAAVPTLILMAYNMSAFGAPWEMGYFHHANAQFAKVHNRQNPLGLRRPDPSLVVPLLWGEYRGLLFYAPILFLAAPGWLLLAARRCFDIAAVSLSIVVVIFIVNLSYPEWTGGWSTGPRLLVPLLPFAMIPVAAVLGGGSRWSRIATAPAAALAIAGGVLIFLFQGVGARVPQDVHAPLRALVWPIWTGRGMLPTWWTGQRFAATVGQVLANDWEQRLLASRQALQFLPLVVGQVLAIVAIFWTAREGSGGTAAATLDLGVDEKEKGGCTDQDAQDPEAKAKRVHPDSRP